jgi:hypothetical protein
MDLKNFREFYNRKPIEFVPFQRNDLREDVSYVPRFSLKNVSQISSVPINEPIKPTLDLIIKAIKYGMIFLINYKGEKDDHFAGHERVIYPMVVGKSSVGKILIRGYHLNGWSVSGSRHMVKIWRMFRLDRVLSMTFTGSFYRLPPSGYNMNDRGMRGGIIAKADFIEIRKNQQTLVNSQKIQNKEDIQMVSDDRTFASIMVKATDTVLDLNKPMENSYISNMKDIANVRLSFLNSVYGNKYFVILGALGRPGNTIKIVDDSGKNYGVFKVIDSIFGKTLSKIKRIKGNNLFDVYVFDKKL